MKKLKRRKVSLFFLKGRKKTVQEKQSLQELRWSQVKRSQWVKTRPLFKRFRLENQTYLTLLIPNVLLHLVKISNNQNPHLLQMKWINPNKLKTLGHLNSIRGQIVKQNQSKNSVILKGIQNQNEVLLKRINTFIMHLLLN